MVTTVNSFRGENDLETVLISTQPKTSQILQHSLTDKWKPVLANGNSCLQMDPPSHSGTMSRCSGSMFGRMGELDERDGRTMLIKPGLSGWRCRALYVKGVM